MQEVMQKAQELAEVILVSPVYTRMKELEEAVENDPEAYGLMNDLAAKRHRVEELLTTKNVDPDALKQAGKEMKAAETLMNANARIQELKKARKAFSEMMDNVNRILRLVITGEVDQEDFAVGADCAGNCDDCAGCSY